MSLNIQENGQRKLVASGSNEYFGTKANFDAVKDSLPAGSSFDTIDEPSGDANNFPPYIKPVVNYGELLFGGYSKKDNLVIVNMRIISKTSDRVTVQLPEPLENGNYVSCTVYNTTDNILIYGYMTNEGIFNMRPGNNKEYLITFCYIAR